MKEIMRKEKKEKNEKCENGVVFGTPANQNRAAEPFPRPRPRFPLLFYFGGRSAGCCSWRGCFVLETLPLFRKQLWIGSRPGSRSP